jgi:hypothetical protein
MRIRRPIRTLIVATSFPLLVTVTGTTSAAAAASASGTVEASLGLNVHTASPTGAVIDTMPYGAVATISCWTTGPYIAATWPDGEYYYTNTWDDIEGYTYNGQSYTYSGSGKPNYSSDAWLNTGADTSTLVGKCK